MIPDLATQGDVYEYIDKRVKKAVDIIANGIKEKYDYQFSEATILSMVLLTDNFIERLTSLLNSENLLEPESFIRSNDSF